MSNFPPAVPAALARQHAMAHQRGVRGRDQDETASQSGSVSSWDQVGEDEPVQADANRLGSIPEGSAAVPKAPPPPAAPVTQAAHGLLNYENEPAHQRKLRKQQERAQRRGYRNARSGQMGGVHNAANLQLPPHLSQVGAGEGERSVMLLDSRDHRMQSPFQGWLLDEILMNARSYVSVLSDRQLIRSPSDGYHFSLFYMKTLSNMKLVVVGSMTSYASVPCGKWDEKTGEVLGHPAFQPFRWPLMANDSPTWVDLKVKIEGHLLIHMELRGYRSDADMSVQINYVSDAAVQLLPDMVFIPTVIVTVFQGWRIVAVSWEVGGRLYACSDGGVVVALDFPLCHFEVRLVANSSADAFGLDADRVEFRFLSAADRLDVGCSTAAIPPTWLVVSRVSGPTLIKNARWCRDHHARIEGPDQTLQMSQLAMVHAHWTVAVDARDMDDVGPRISAISVESHPSNLHLTCESPLFRPGRHLVPKTALALQEHKASEEVLTQVLPPIDDGPSVRPAHEQVPNVKALAGPSGSNVDMTIVTMTEAKPSITEPGISHGPSSLTGGSLAPHRRSFEERQGGQIDHSAVTPQHFVNLVQQTSERSKTSGVSEVEIQFLGGSLDASDSQQSSGPRSFGPSAPP